MANTLLEELQRINAEAREWQAAGENRWAGILTEDLDHWAGYGITTVEQLNEYFDACEAKEARKEAYYVWDEEDWAAAEAKDEAEILELYEAQEYQAPKLGDLFNLEALAEKN